MTKLKPKIGMLFLTSGWFREVGLQTSASQLTDDVQKIADEIIDNMSAFCDPIYSGIIYSTEDAEFAAQKINQAGVDGLIISPLMWCEDQILIAALKNKRRTAGAEILKKYVKETKKRISQLKNGTLPYREMFTPIKMLGPNSKLYRRIN